MAALWWAPYYCKGGFSIITVVLDMCMAACIPNDYI